MAYGRVLWRAFHRYPPLISLNHRAASSAKVYISRVTPRFVKSHLRRLALALHLCSRLPSPFPSPFPLLSRRYAPTTSPPFPLRKLALRRFLLLGHGGEREGVVGFPRLRLSPLVARNLVSRPLAFSDFRFYQRLPFRRPRWRGDEK